MKALFLIFHGFSPHNGISKKISYQIHALQYCGVETKLCYLITDKDGLHKRMIDNEILESYGKGIIAKIKKRVMYSRLEKYILNTRINLLYIRSFHNANPFLIRMLKKLKYSGVKSIMEIPTYPYDNEYKSVHFYDHLDFSIDKIFRHQLAKYIERIVTFSNHKVIYGVPTINISNGIDFDQIKVKTKLNDNKNNLRLIAVAEIHFWHGFDRVINGLAEYYKRPVTTTIIFDIVGYGDEELIKLRELVAKYDLEKVVFFHGPKSGKELDELFEKADIGVASLARHRSHIIHIKPLKNREYAARGIPFIYSEIDDDFEHMPYIMKIPADENPVNIESLIRFYYSRKFEPNEIRTSIIEKLSWHTQMKKVVDAISQKAF